MMRTLGHPLLVLICRFILGFFFLYASLSKIGSPISFVHEVGNYKLLPGSVVPLFALALPWIELLAGICLIVGLKTRPASLLVGCLVIMFLVSMGLAMARGLDISCGCFKHGEDAGALGWGSILMDLGFLASACIVYYGRDRWLRINGPRQRAASESS